MTASDAKMRAVMPIATAYDVIDQHLDGWHRDELGEDQYEYFRQVIIQYKHTYDNPNIS
jgi:hypothetical protein